MVICNKSSDQGMLQRGDQTACKRVRLSKTNICKAFCRNIKQSRTIFECDQGKISPIKNLDPGCKWFYRHYECDYPLLLKSQMRQSFIMF